MLESIGNYKILKKLGEGGMGTILLGQEQNSDKQVAIKIVKTEVATANNIIARFKHEINISKEFAHPFVIKIIDGGVAEEQHLLYLVMELLKGQNLGEKYKNNLIDNEAAHRIFAQVSEALSYIHQKGVTHRDIKPDNIFITLEDRTVLLDFGLALVSDLTRLSQTSDRPGTLTTMSPEQLAGKKLDSRSDIYSLGITMYWAMTGIAPYNIDAIIAIATGTTPPNIPTPCEINESIAPYLSRAVMKCMSIDKEERFDSADSLLKTLTRGKIPQRETRASQISIKERSPSKAKLKMASTLNGTCPKKLTNGTDGSKGKQPDRKVVVKLKAFKRTRAIIGIIILTLSSITGIFLLFFAGGKEPFHSYSKTIESKLNPHTEGDISSTKEGKIFNSQQLALYRLTETYLQRTSIANADECEKLGELIKSQVPPVQLPYGTNYPSRLTGLYYLYRSAMKKQLWPKAFSYIKEIVRKFGYNNFTKNGFPEVILLLTAAKEFGKIDEVILFNKKMAATAGTSKQKWNSLLALGQSLLYSLNDLPSKSDNDEERRLILAELLATCRTLKTTYPDNDVLEDLAPLYLKTLSELDGDHYRNEGLQFMDEWVTKDVTPIALLTLYSKTSAMLMSTRSDGWTSIPRKQVLLALTYMNKAFKIGTEISDPNLYKIVLSLADCYSALGDDKSAYKLMKDLIQKQPELSRNVYFIRRYASIMMKEMKFDQAISLLEDVLEENKTSRHIPPITVIDIEESIDDYKRYKLLATFQSPTPPK